MRRLWVQGVTVLGLSVVLASAPRAVAPKGVEHTATTATTSVDSVGGGGVVVTLHATGEMAGVLTLDLRPAGKGTYDGTWSFTVAHTDNTDPDTGLEPPVHEEGEVPDEDHPHLDFVRLVHRGSMSGTVTGALLTINNGSLASLSAPLGIDGGASEFAGIAGTGVATLTTLSLNY